ncbi:MAG: DUF1501 domain-containing protein [Gemmataceae bacterium]|nr:DUF1501 domain-containing protein [Gemmataceae bacterium]
MFSLWGTKHQHCDGISRRDFLKVGSLGAGLTLADLLRLKAEGAVRPKTRGKSVIMVNLAGGISHLDTYDMKANAPAEFRGEFAPIKTRVPGVDLCELLPLHAQVADKFSIIRGLQAYSREHNFFEHTTGASEEWKPRRPAIGSVISRLRGETTMPQFVNLCVTLGNVLLQPDPSYLGAAHRAFVPQGRDLDNLVLRRMTPDRLADRKSLLQSLDSVRRDLDARQEMAALDTFQARALDMILSGEVREAFDVSREPDRVRAKYAAFPQLLLARRLVESGVGLVTTLLTANTIGVGSGSWDYHSDNFRCLRRGLPTLDSAVHTLLTDLCERGLDQDVLVVFCGEFGRTPRINREAGRDHWASTNCALLAGGGLRMGQVVGDSGPRGEQDISGKYTPQTLAAMIYHALDIDPATTLPDHTGRPVYLLDSRDKITEFV